MSERPLAGKVALVSGASRGLGRATAVELAAAGAYVVCTARSTREAATQTKVDDLTLEGTLDAVRAAGGDGEWHRCDHTEPGQVEALLRDVLDRHGRVDVLVNNAWGGHDLHDDPGGEEVWDEPMEQFRAMLLSGAYSDFVTTMLTLRLAMGPARRGSSSRPPGTPPSRRRGCPTSRARPRRTGSSTRSATTSRARASP